VRDINEFFYVRFYGNVRVAADGNVGHSDSNNNNNNNKNDDDDEDAEYPITLCKLIHDEI